MQSTGTIVAPTESASLVSADIEALTRRMEDAKRSIGRVIFGQHDVVEQSLVTLLAGGHALLMGVPGLGKTRLVETLGAVLGLAEKRVQFTPDLMPEHILGSEILEQDEVGRRAFRFIEGPVFTQLLMADEINRASPRTQSALLQAMQERRVSVAGQYRPLPRPFHVLATQNPIEQEGTFPLPEAQLDRFLLEIRVTYPDLETERAILSAVASTEEERVDAVMTPSEFLEAQRLVRRVPVPPRVEEMILQLARACRPETSEIASVRECVAWGPGPRAVQALALAARARVVLDPSEPSTPTAPRTEVSEYDIRALALPVLRHRMSLGYAARADGYTVEDVIGEVLDRVDPEGA